MAFWRGPFRAVAGGLLCLASVATFPAFLTGAVMAAADDVRVPWPALEVAARYLILCGILAIPVGGAWAGFKLAAAGARTAGWLPLRSTDDVV